MARATLGRLIPLLRRGQRPVCVMLPGAGGGLQPYLRLAGFFGQTHNVYAVRAAGLIPDEEPEDRVQVMADSAVRALDEAGIVPDLVFGWSMGGVIGWETCVRLADRGVRPALVLLDSSPLPRKATGEGDTWLLDRVVQMLGPRPDRATVERVRRTLLAQMAALSDYRTERPYAGRVLLVTCSDPDPMRQPSVQAWRTLASDLREGHLDVDHFEVFDQVHLPGLVDALTPFLDRDAGQPTTRAAGSAV
ncbi:hypothetical protein GCM10027290_58770 [Micromonospora sonneratiae]|uniref:Alpha/beta fold hydrolase n=1 Tax=Micromonospora sonneratiae TaxID=1184706 RepID=A0ABW3YM82_9ACTN